MYGVLTTLSVLITREYVFKARSLKHRIVELEETWGSFNLLYINDYPDSQEIRRFT